LGAATGVLRKTAGVLAASDMKAAHESRLTAKALTGGDWADMFGRSRAGGTSAELGASTPCPGQANPLRSSHCATKGLVMACAS
jgi:hypothetical protein